MTKISVTESGNIMFEEVFNSIAFKSPNGQILSVCMRDDGFEVGISSKADASRFTPLLWYTANNGKISPLAPQDL